MQTETKKVEGWQQHAKLGDTPDLPAPALTPAPATFETEIPDELKKLYRAIHGGLDDGHMSWVK